MNPRFFSNFTSHSLIRVAPAGGGKEVKVKATTRKKYSFFTFLFNFGLWSNLFVYYRCQYIVTTDFKLEEKFVEFSKSDYDATRNN